MRIAYVSVANTLYLFGGEASSVHNLANLCDREGWYLDLVVNASCASRIPYMDNTFIPRFQKSEQAIYLSVLAINTGPVLVDNMAGIFSSCYNLLESFSRRIPDIIILSNPLFASILYPFKVHEYIPLYIYTHLTQLLYDVRSVIDKDVIDAYKLLCNLPGISLLTQHTCNIPILRKLTSNNVEVLPPCDEFQPRGHGASGIVYVGGASEVKDPGMMASIFQKFHSRHPEVPLIAIGNQSEEKLNRLFEGFELYCKASRGQIQDILSRTKLGVNSSKGESFGLAIYEQLEHYPVILRHAGYNAIFPFCPTFASVDEAVYQLEKYYFDQDEYKRLRATGVQYMQEHYSHLEMHRYVVEAAWPDQGRTVREHTQELVCGHLSKVAIPISELYQSLGWSSSLLGMRALTILSAKGSCELLQDKDCTYVGLPGCKMPIVGKAFF